MVGIKRSRVYGGNMMNIWVEYFINEDNRSHLEGSHAQMKEQAKWVKPDPKDVHKRFCQNREDANRFAKSMNDRGYHATIKTDGYGNIN